jgi:hypothetical protein
MQYMATYNMCNPYFVKLKEPGSYSLLFFARAGRGIEQCSVCRVPAQMESSPDCMAGVPRVHVLYTHVVRL